MTCHVCKKPITDTRGAAKTPKGQIVCGPCRQQRAVGIRMGTHRHDQIGSGQHLVCQNVRGVRADIDAILCHNGNGAGIEAVCFQPSRGEGKSIRVRKLRR